MVIRLNASINLAPTFFVINLPTALFHIIGIYLGAITTAPTAVCNPFIPHTHKSATSSRVDLFCIPVSSLSKASLVSFTCHSIVLSICVPFIASCA